jgi:hypothetical protein
MLPKRTRRGRHELGVRLGVRGVAALALAVEDPEARSAAAREAGHEVDAGVFVVHRDELNTGDMWNSNWLISWLLACSGHDTDAIASPAHDRAPGWTAGLVVAARRADTRHPTTFP